MTRLCDILLEGAPDATAGGELEEVLTAAVDAARAAWPDVELSAERFVAHLAHHVDGDATVAVAAMNTADLFLACACIHGDRNALAAFESHCMPALERALGRLATERGLGDEAKQAVRERLLVADGEAPPRLASYSGRGSLPAWVRVAGMRVALNLRQKTQREAPLDDDVLADAAAPDDPELAYLKDHYRKEFKAAFHEALAGLEARDRNLLRNQLLDGLTIDEIGALHDVHRATAARWLERVRRELQRGTRALLTERLNLSRGELDSVARLVLSQFDASVRRVLRESDD